MPLAKTDRSQDIEQFYARKRRRRLLIAGMLLLVAALLWIWHDQCQFHVCMAFDAADPVVEIRSDGFLAAGEKTPYTFYDWHGRPRWQIDRTRRHRYLRVHDAYMELAHQYALSPNGQYLSLVDGGGWGSRCTLVTWHHGTCIRKYTLPFVKIDSVLQLDDGRLFVSGRGASSGYRTILLKDSRIVAAADHWVLRDIALDLRMASAMQTSPVAGVLLAGFHPCGMNLTGNRINLLSIKRLPNGTPLDKGAVFLNDSGLIFRQGSLRPLIPGLSFGSYARLSPDRQYAIFIDNALISSLVVSLNTGKQWKIDLPSASGLISTGITVSNGGQFAVVPYDRDMLPLTRMLFTAYLRPLASRLPQHKQSTVFLFQQPGHQVAEISEREMTGNLSPGFLTPSPNGRALAGVVKTRDGKFRCILMRRGRWN